MKTKGLKAVNGKVKIVEESLAEPAANQTVIQVACGGLNRADVEQANGEYPPPPGVTDLLGLECSGVSGGQRVMALVSGGAFAEHVIADKDCVMPVPDFLTNEEAAVLPESLFTFWANSVIDGGLDKGQTFLVHGGASGLGSFSIMMAKAMGAQVFTTARGADRVEFARSLGADKVVDTQGLDAANLKQKM